MPTATQKSAERVLIVEDEILVAIDIESVLGEMGLAPVGIAADKTSALRLAERADVALVDINLRDGPTGPQIGRDLAARGITVLFMTANPEQLGNGVPGTLGVLTKPVADAELRQAIRFAVSRREKERHAPPRSLQLFDSAA
ncbi:response regulator [Paradevosia shaoguanensis]|uniref:Response regulator n=1 Tax=Paradevosia shaoguanensis TaxID=1335043 RepID=A0AA41QM02_9HYPH|nr:response regulator [Paradevosia shaoguanensis]MCF1741811.1 response regulator [Paradevosia shaoguanensis]MCI0126294.1 response regulator [Paradevosia shaoguanensis]